MPNQVETAHSPEKTSGLANRFFLSHAFVGITAALLFIILKNTHHLGLIADDYVYAARSYEANFSIHAFEIFISRRPVFAWLNFQTFRTHLQETSDFLFPIYFALYACALSKLLSWFCATALPKRKFDPRFTFLTALVLSFHPGVFELTLMTLNLPYSLGTAFLAIGLPSRNRYIRYFMYVCSFCTFECYILPALVIPLAAESVRYLQADELSTSLKNKLSRFTKDFGLPWLSAGLTYAAIRKLFQTPDSMPYYVDFSIANFQERLSDIFYFLWSIDFYRVNWACTAILWSVMIFIVVALVRSKMLKAMSIAALLLLPLASAALILPLNYYAPRAVHGSLVMNLLSIGLLLMLFTSIDHRARRSPYLLLSILAVSFAVQYTIIFRVKDRNQAEFARQESRILKEVEICGTPCTVNIGKLSEGLRGDWAMPDTIRLDFANYVLRRNHVEKPVQFSY